MPDILGCFPEAEGGMYPGYLRNYGEAGFPKVHRGAESRVVVPLDGGGPYLSFQGKKFFKSARLRSRILFK